MVFRHVVFNRICNQNLNRRAKGPQNRDIKCQKKYTQPIMALHPYYLPRLIFYLFKTQTQ